MRQAPQLRPLAWRWSRAGDVVDTGQPARHRREAGLAAIDATPSTQLSSPSSSPAPPLLPGASSSSSSSSSIAAFFASTRALAFLVRQLLRLLVVAIVDRELALLGRRRVLPDRFMDRRIQVLQTIGLDALLDVLENNCWYLALSSSMSFSMYSLTWAPLMRSAMASASYSLASLS